jgi:hypothetical protein
MARREERAPMGADLSAITSHLCESFHIKCGRAKQQGISDGVV